MLKETSSHEGIGRHRNSFLSLAFMAAISGTLLVSSPAAHAETQTETQDERVSIPDGDLNQSLRTLAAQRGVTITADSALIRGLYGNTVNGRYSVSLSGGIL